MKMKNESLGGSEAVEVLKKKFQEDSPRFHEIELH
jgi:hypothetical protein